MKMICEVPDEVIKCIKDGMWCGSHVLEKMIANGIPLSSSEKPNKSEIMTGWIPVSERLPEDGERVLATHLGGINPDRQVIEHIYQNGKFVLGWDMDTNVDSPTFGQRYMGEIIAWMPLPEPYKAESEE